MRKVLTAVMLLLAMQVTAQIRLNFGEDSPLRKLQMA
jgi:hypothetical protein